MKNFYFTFFVLTLSMGFLSQQAKAQAPQSMSYQSVIRNSSNALVATIPVGMQISLLQGTASGTAVYVESQTATTNANGLVSIEIGTGTATTGTFSEIDWATGSYFIKTEIDPAGGNNYTITGTQQVMSVPYALYANSAGNSQSATPDLETVLAENNSANNLQIKNLADPTDAQDAATKAYTYSKAEVDALIADLQDQINNPGDSSYPAGTVHCNPNNPTAVVDVLNPTTGKTWMDRNLGASQVAISSTDELAYGDLYQWGRRADGHQCRNSATTTTLSSTDQPAHGDFILAPNSPFDWRSPQNGNLWQGVNGTNNPCPSGYRLPTETELNAELTSWSSNDPAGAFASPLKLPMAGYRFYSDGWLLNVGTFGRYWSSTVSTAVSRLLFFSSSNAFVNTSSRASGISVRCLKD